LAIVVDANLVAALVLPLPYSSQAAEAFDHWRSRGERLIAPILLEYELTSVVRNGVALKELRAERAQPVLDQLQRSGVETVIPTLDLHRRAIRFAETIGQSKAYDAQYLALAARENAPLWTADRRLVDNARQAGLSWVHWVGDWRENDD
jgi:predicted nucleic acid-binding protein